MPPALTKAHTELDRAVDRCYRQEPFPSARDRDRVEYPFQLYEQLTAPLLPANKNQARPQSQNRRPALKHIPSPSGRG